MLFLKKIFSPASLSLSLFLLVYVFYKAEIYWDGAQVDFYKKYYNICFCLIIFSILSFFLNQNIKEIFIITLISLVVGLYISEVYFTFKKQTEVEQSREYKATNEQSLNKKKYKIYEKEGKKYDKRDRLQIFNDLKKINSKITLAFHPSENISNKKKIFNLSGIADSETIYCNENGYYSIYKSDRYGFNNPNDEWDKKEIEYLLVGDSFTQGACVNRPDDIASVLRILSNKSALNLGMSGNGPLIEYAVLREYLNPNVKKVIWLYYEGNDQTDLLIEKKNDILKNYLNDLTFTQNLKFRQKEIDHQLNEFFDIELNKSQDKKNVTTKINYFLQFIKIYNLRSYISKTTTRKVLYQYEFKKIIELTNDLATKNNSKLYFVYLPEYDRYKNSYNNDSYINIKKIINELKIPFIDISRLVFEKEVDALKLFPFGEFGHYNEIGFKKVADTIYNLTKD